MTQLAAIDLGSNSFRLEIGVMKNNQLTRGEYLKETVRQGNGLDANRMLSDEAMTRGWECLARFAERLQGFEPSQVRAVATQTLREARNSEAFLNPAQAILGFPIDVISGKEEARLIYEGVSHMLPQSIERRLVIDIGGRSCELILGKGYASHAMDSFRVGSVTWSMRYFPDGALTQQAFEMAEVAACAIFDEAAQTYGAGAWDVAYGSSGTMGAVHDILVQGGKIKAADPISLADLDWLLTKMLAAKHIDKLKLEGLKEDRRAIIAGGLSIVRALFKILNIQHLSAADGALRQGVLFDMLERESLDKDMRNETVSAFVQRFQIDAAQGARVSHTALHLLNQLLKSKPDAALTKPAQNRQVRKLGWAAMLHETGWLVSHSDYHKHGSYIVSHSDALGFSQQELFNLSMLILGHKGKLRKLEAEVDFKNAVFIEQLICLRLGVILCHARLDPALKSLSLRSDIIQGGTYQSFSLMLSKRWAEDYPQSYHLLCEEVLAWQKTDHKFELFLS